jgi:hypothetical protein
VSVTNPNVRLNQSVTTCAVIEEREDWIPGQPRIHFCSVSTDRALDNHRDQTTGLLQSKQRDAGGNSPFIDVGHNQTTPEHRQVPSCIDPPRQTSPATELKLFFQIIEFSVTD